MKENQTLMCAGDLAVEMQEAGKVCYSKEEEKVVTLTFECTGLLTIVCC